MDLQAVLLCPSAKASTLYYKAKLPQHDVLTVGTKQAFNYKYDEKQVNLSSSMFSDENLQTDALPLRSCGGVIPQAKETVIIFC
ncbi:hypothetical protein RRG08_013850 [Elysia crispata]|uniref:Uncharacterized protein n=1 Tax=Elysia crispata TaxID=231223 RepID=A0AAE1DL20_9GAST|nr:hypothetical protein RRG08_013850 [Elysia crispata]